LFVFETKDKKNPSL